MIKAKTSRRDLGGKLAAVSLMGSMLHGSPVSAAQRDVDSIVSAVLSQDLWIERDIYDAAHHLMVPMHTAFEQESLSIWRGEFDGFFDRFLSAWDDSTFTFVYDQITMQFLLLVGRYLRLKHECNDLSESNRRLLAKLLEAETIAFAKSPAWHWTQPEFPSCRESIEWKLSAPETERDFHLFIHDQDMFTLAVGADLYALGNVTGMPVEIGEARDLGLRVLRERSTWEVNDGWLFQRGQMWDHPDYAYAGNLKVIDGMEPAPVPNIALDSSHSHRLPLLLNCFDPGNREPEISAEIGTFRQGLTTQFVNHVLILPDDSFPNIRTTNYMDGHNGLYRWNYATQGEGNGYRPFELSGTLLLGWWSLLDDVAVTAAYQILAGRFPLAEAEIVLYVGPNTTRERNPLFALPDSMQDGGAMMLAVMCAADLA